MTVAVINEEDIISRIKVCIDKCRENKDNILKIIVTPTFFETLDGLMSKAPAIDSLTVQKKKIYMYEEMRIQLIKIDHYV